MKPSSPVPEPAPLPGSFVVPGSTGLSPLVAELLPRLAAVLASPPPRIRAPTADERTGTTVSGELRERIARDLHQDELELASRLVRATLRALAEDAVDVSTAVDRILRTLDALLAAGEVAAAGRAIGALQAEVRESPVPAVVEAGTIVTSALADRRRLDRLLELVAPGGAAAPEEASRWLLALPPKAIPVLLDVLELLEGSELRAVLREAIAVLGREEPAPIVARLAAAGPEFAKELLRLIDRLEPPNRVELLARTLRHPSPEVRREVLHALARLRTEAARAPIAAALDDPSPEVRTEAVTLLGRCGPERALQELLRTIRSSGFADRRAAERAAFFRAVGETGIPGALAFFQEVLEARGPWGRGRGREEKLLAIGGLAAFPSIGAYRLLQVARSDADPDVAGAATAACVQIRAALVGAEEER